MRYPSNIASMPPFCLGVVSTSCRLRLQGFDVASASRWLRFGVVSTCTSASDARQRFHTSATQDVQLSEGEDATSRPRAPRTEHMTRCELPQPSDLQNRDLWRGTEPEVDSCFMRTRKGPHGGCCRQEGTDQGARRPIAHGTPAFTAPAARRCVVVCCVLAPPLNVRWSHWHRTSMHCTAMTMTVPIVESTQSNTNSR